MSPAARRRRRIVPGSEFSQTLRSFLEATEVADRARRVGAANVPEIADPLLPQAVDALNDSRPGSVVQVNFRIYDAGGDAAAEFDIVLAGNTEYMTVEFKGRNLGKHRKYVANAFDQYWRQQRASNAPHFGYAPETPARAIERLNTMTRSGNPGAAFAYDFSQLIDLIDLLR